MKTREELEEENEILRFKLQELLGTAMICPVPDMSMTHFRLISLLARRAPNVVTHNALHHAMTDHPEDLKEPHNCLKVHISRLRGHLKPYEIEIKLDWGVGYFVPSESKTKWDHLVAQANGMEVAA